MTRLDRDTIITPDEAFSVIARFYPPESELTQILLKHSNSVADKAVEINKRCRLDLNEEAIRVAALLHDIGIFLTNAPGIHCHGVEPYIRHGVLGAALLRREGLPEWAARVAERHTGLGITAREIQRNNLPLPNVDLMPESLLEKLICYADKFYSKSGDMKEKSVDHIRTSLAKHFPESLCRFDDFHKLFKQ